MKPGRAVASFDSASGMVRALSRHLRGADVPLLGQLPAAAEAPASALLGGVNRLPRSWAERAYALSGIAEGVPPARTGEVDAESLARWVVDHYPRRRYDVVLLGSSNGAAVHLAAALGAPWLPQTLLVPVRRGGVDRDDAHAELAAGLEPGRALLEANPDVVLHHMQDPNQDRLMIRGMSYFRIKWRRLPRAYRDFLDRHLAPGGVVVTVECDARWPVTEISDRHLFQFGAFGGATADEYHRGGPRVAEFLRERGASVDRWHPPEPDAQHPEAEWGFSARWCDDIADRVQQLGARWCRLGFDGPEGLSAAVAEVHRRWHRLRGVPDERLLLDCFLLMDPRLAVLTGSAPYWLTFPVRSSLQSAHDYLDEVGAFDELRLTLFSHGLASIGVAPVGEWRALLDRAAKVGATAGVDERAFPRDFAAFARAHRALSRIRHRYPAPPDMPWDEAADVLRQRPEVRLRP